MNMWKGEVPERYLAVKRVRSFYALMILFTVILVVLFVINLLTSRYFWVKWTALGFGIALFFKGIHAFFPYPFRSWERQQIAKQMAKNATKHQ